MHRLAAFAFGLSSWAAAAATNSTLSLAEITQLIIAITGLIAAVSAFVLGWKSRRDDPRDKLLEMLLKERKETADGEPPAMAPTHRRRRRS